MSRIQWARASQFNWTFDNMGGAPLQEAVAGGWSGASVQVQADGQVVIQSPNQGGGQVFFVRGVWLRDTIFPWDGFWADPIDGDLTNYYTGGSFTNQGATTSMTLGTGLPADTWVQCFYIYSTGEQAAKYEALNSYPCIRRAYRSGDDYSYDFAVDRMLDLMGILYFAGLEGNSDYDRMREFLWKAFFAREASLTSPLVYDSFERQLWDRGNYLIYRGATTGADAFQDFEIASAAGASDRVLHVRVNLPTLQDGAWFGYGLDWSLEESPFSDLDRVWFKVQGRADSRKIHNLTKIGSGSANLVISGDYADTQKRRFVIQIESGGEVGQATFRWSQDGGNTWKASGVRTGDSQHPVTLAGDLQVYWEGGAGADLVAGDYWTFWGGEPAEHPRRLLVTLNDSIPGTADPWGAPHLFVHAMPDRFAEMTAFEVPFSQFWRRDNIIDDGDRRRAMWGAWYSATQADESEITISDREETEVLSGETFYTQRQVSWELSPYVTAFGVWAGIDPESCDSTGQTQVNFLLKPEVADANSLVFRVKVKDAQGSYFYQDITAQVNAWQRVAVNLADLALESGQLPLTHPLQVVDVGLPASPPGNGTFYLTDLKFGEHLTFAGAKHLRLLEFKMESQGLADHEWWLDDVGLNLEAEDAYPYVPRLAISLGPQGQNPWRGPTLVHYAHPLAPYLAGALNLSQNYFNLHRDAQNEFHTRYGGVKGPIMPVHTRNDVENIALCGEENFGKFCWWPRYRDYGKVSGAWHFNEALTDASGHGHTLAWSSGSPAYATGVCQPGLTAVSFDGSAYASLASNSLLEPGTEPFSITLILKGPPAGGGDRLLEKMGAGDGWVIQAKGAGSPDVQMKIVTSAGESFADIVGVLDGDYHMIAWMAAPAAGKIYKIKDGVLLGTDDLALGSGIGNTAPLTIGSEATFTLDFLKYERRKLPAAEYQNSWDIVRGLMNGSAYPEVGHALGQYWAFYRLAQYYFVANDAAAGEILNNWLAWLKTVATFGQLETGPLPIWFSDYGFRYGSPDPGAMAAAVIGLLFLYMRNGNADAASLARSLLDDLRLYRQSGDYGGMVYQSDYHYAWLNALVATAFGLAAHGCRGQAYTFASLPEDAAHFDAMVAQFFTLSGDTKPNVLNADRIPFTYLESADVWDYAPYYLFMRQMGSLEGVVLMLGVALEYAKEGQGDWTWFELLLRFILVDNLAVLTASQIRSLTTSYELAGAKNLVRVKYGDYDQDNSRYAEAREETAIATWGEQPAALDFRYGQPVVLENQAMAESLASRLLKRLAGPREQAEVITWLEGARMELGDTLAVSSDFHGFERAEFTIFGKAVDLKKRQVTLTATRPLNWSWAWGNDAAGSDYDTYAIDQNSLYDTNWPSRSYAG
jgi:hypothetical protein